MGRKSKKIHPRDLINHQYCKETDRITPDYINSSIKKSEIFKGAAICCLLLLLVALVFGKTIGFDFVNYDDGVYIFENRQVMNGLTAKGVAWAFTSNRASNWHPITWISHMLDVQTYGLNAGGHHLTNVLLHASVTILLFLVLWRMTGFMWRSTFVAAFFAVHPLRVESVAWISERKDLLSGLFFVLILWVYISYVRRPFSLGRYLVIFILFGLGLMAKPMLVTLPFVLLLLDYWPLGRIESGKGGSSSSLRRVLIEKLPLLLLTFLSCIATYIAQGRAIAHAVGIPLSSRISNALVSYVAYIGKLFYPVGLSPFYPHPGNSLPIWQVIVSILLLTWISTLFFLWRRRYPYLLVGWLWYLGMLIPVIGLVRVGFQSMADRYTYLPQIGLILILTWGLSQLAAAWRVRRWECFTVSILVLVILMGVAYRQVSYWRDGLTLWTHALACTGHDPVVDYNFRDAVKRSSKGNKDIAYYKRLIKKKPYSGDAHYNLGVLLAERGQVDSAIDHYQQALKIRSDDTDTLNNLANALITNGKIDAAIGYYRKALEIKPNNAEVHNNLGVALEKRGQTEETIRHYMEALKINPDYAEAHNNLALVLVQRGQTDSAIAHYKKALEINPAYVEAHNNLGNVLAGQGQMEAAAVHYRKAMELKPAL